MKPKIVNISYSRETSEESLVWIHQLILKILVRELNLDPLVAGDLIKQSFKLF